MVTKWALEYLPGNVKPGTARRYLVSSRQLDPYFRDLYVDEISKKKIAGMISARVKLGATNATIRRDLTALSTMLSCATGWGWTEENPAKAFDRGIIKERRDPIHPPDSDSLAAFVGKLRTDGLGAFAAMVAFLAATGMREEEAASLEWSQVDLKKAQVQLVKTKTNRPRVVPLNGEAGGILGGMDRHPDSKVVFWHHEGERYRNVASRYAALKKRHGFAARAHDLRHKFAIDYLRGGGDIYALKTILGHSSVKTTEMYLGFVGGQKGA